jgi:hypothetical protein
MKRNDYKHKNLESPMQKLNKKGQLTIFIIVAIVILAAVLIILFYPKIKTAISGELNPNSYLKSCIEPVIEPNLELLSKQGGYLNPEGFLYYNNTRIKLLCYTPEFYKTCTVQQPMIKAHIEQELTKVVAERTRECVNNLKSEYESRGYSVLVGKGDYKLEIVPGKILVDFNMPFTVTKETTQTFKSFSAEIDSNMYDLLMIAQNIVEFESTLGDSETLLYMQYYPDLRIDKTKLSDGTKVYVVSDVVTKESFTFASRGLSWPPGYGLK